jgi:peptidoglycan/LPS O-acetylase OafA/YrhL
VKGFSFPTSRWYAILTLSGCWAVPMFFTLSGYVLCLPYKTGKRKMETKEEAVEFLKRRCSRIMPLYCISMLLFILLDRGDGLDHAPRDLSSLKSFRQMLLAATMTFNFSSDEFHPYYSTSMWSLGVEMIFSALVPALMWLICRENGTFKPVPFLFSTAMFFLVARTIWEVSSPISSICGGTPPPCHPLSSICGGSEAFVWGMLACFFPARFARWWTASVGIVCALVGLSFLDEFHVGSTTGSRPGLGRVFASELLFMGMGMLVFGLVHSEKQRTQQQLLQTSNSASRSSIRNININWQLPKWQQPHFSTLKSVLLYCWCNPFTVWCGRACFSLYVWQTNSLNYMMNNAGRLQRQPADAANATSSDHAADHSCSNDGLGHIAVTLVLLLLLSAASYRWIEFPTRTLAELFELRFSCSAPSLPSVLPVEGTGTGAVDVDVSTEKIAEPEAGASAGRRSRDNLSKVAPTGS